MIYLQGRMPFGMTAHSDRCTLTADKNFEFIKSKMADSRHLENRHKLPYFSNGSTQLPQNMAR